MVGHVHSQNDWGFHLYNYNLASAKYTNLQLGVAFQNAGTLKADLHWGLYFEIRDRAGISNGRPRIGIIITTGVLDSDVNIIFKSIFVFNIWNHYINN